MFEFCKSLHQDSTRCGEEGSKNKTVDGRKLHENIDWWSTCVLKWVSNSVTNNSSNMSLSSLFECVVASIIFLDLRFVSTSFNVLLGVIPGSSSVRERNSNLNSRDNFSCQKSRNGLGSEEKSKQEGSDDHKASWSNHLSDTGLGTNLDAGLVIRVFLFVSDGRVFELFLDFSNHIISSNSDSAHCQGWEGIREHSSNQETRESKRLKDIYWSISSSGNEGSEKSKSNQASRSNSESFSNSGSGVSSSIKLISVLSDLWVESSHFSNSSSIVSNWSISINGQGNWKASEHSEGRESNSVHISKGERNKDSNGQADDWDNSGHVSESQT